MRLNQVSLALRQLASSCFKRDSSAIDARDQLVHDLATGLTAVGGNYLNGKDLPTT